MTQDLIVASSYALTLTHTGNARMLAALVGILQRSEYAKSDPQNYGSLRKRAITSEGVRRVRQKAP